MIFKLLEFAEEQDGVNFVDAPEVIGYAAEQIHYHIALCHEAEYLEAQKVSDKGRGNIHVYAIGPLTWAGHEALDRYRNGK